MALVECSDPMRDDPDPVTATAGAPRWVLATVIGAALLAGGPGLQAATPVTPRRLRSLAGSFPIAFPHARRTARGRRRRRRWRKRRPARPISRADSDTQPVAEPVS